MEIIAEEAMNQIYRLFLDILILSILKYVYILQKIIKKYLMTNDSILFSILK